MIVLVLCSGHSSDILVAMAESKCMQVIGDNGITYIVNYETTKPLEMPTKCRGELMLHQSGIITVLMYLENLDSISTTDQYGNVGDMRANRYKVVLPMGAGKTKMAIGLVIKSPFPRLRPIYFSSGRHIDGNYILQERTFVPEVVIRPTLVVVPPSVYGQWIDHINEFSTLRICQVCDSRSIIKAVDMINTNLAKFNDEYDIVLVNYKSITGNVDAITSKLPALYLPNTIKSKNMYMLLMNALTRRCILRIIYDDSEFHIRTAPLENAVSCIYLSATQEYGSSGFKNISPSGAKSVDRDIEFASYDFSATNFRNLITVTAEANFISESIHLGLGYHIDASGTIIAKDGMSSMMPAEPEVYMCHINNRDSFAIDIINTLCDDAKIMESVNNMSKTSFGAVIKELMAGRYKLYCDAMRIIAHYEAIDLTRLEELPKPPEGESFTIDNLLRCEPIVYYWRDLPNRIADVVTAARLTVKNELIVLDRVKSHLGGECAICMDSMQQNVCVIMMCCNNILHMACVLRCAARRCAFCREPYGQTSKETFAILHHNTDYAPFISATGAPEILAATKSDEKVAAEITKISVLNDILRFNFARVPRKQVRLNKLRALTYDEAVVAPTENRAAGMKALIYCSADDTLQMIERDIAIDYARLTSSASATYKKIMRFRSLDEPTAILANTWRDAAGIDFKMATDIIIINYVEATAVVQQMIARILRIGRVTRPRIWLLSYTNEMDRWLTTFVSDIGA